MRYLAKQFWLALVVTSVMTMTLSTALGQTYTATVTGNVADPQGSAIAGAKVVAINQGTKLEYAVQTNDSGVYTIPFLPIGDYVLSAEA
ncbi:MAG: carboxypeptidase regulatory-like domain-containing protein, partial [Acidobacteria bacterium]|nr:carboxypeptidase regulatory-like domain-containing protein [Acidobacteriota bacterium]